MADRRPAELTRVRHSFSRTRHAVAAGMAIAGSAAMVIAGLPAIASGVAAAAVTHPGQQRVTYLGYSFEVPRGWPVINLDHHRATCVRFDHHAVYLGSVPRNQGCPSLVVGTTEAMLIQPGSRHAAPVSIKNEVTRRITVIAARVRVTATFDTRPAEIDRILASAGLPPPVTSAADAAAAGRVRRAAPKRTSGSGQDPLEAQRAARAQLPASVTNYRGRGFDTCAAPSESAMQAWLHSRYRAVGIYIGGSDLACAQPNLTPSWLRDEAAAGWHFIPMYVGPQAAFGEVSASAARQGARAAADAVLQAKRLGFGPGTPLYYDMEGYKPRRAGGVLQFLSAWTSTLHAQGYSSGVYSSSSSGVTDLAQQYGSGKYAMPDIIFDALWNGQASTSDPVLSHGKWSPHHRVHQYNGNVTQTHGGTTIQIDQDYLDVSQSAGPSPSPVTATYPAGATATWYKGRAFDTCSAPSLKAITAWGKSPYRAIGVYIGGVNLACGQSHLTANWVTAVSAQKWRLLPVYVGRQPRCLRTNGQARAVKTAPRTIRRSVAASEGTAAADNAAVKGAALGMRHGSAFYDYIGNYSTGNASCSSAVFTFVSAWTSELHRLGFLAGVYVSSSSGAQELSRAYTWKSVTRPDALWVLNGGRNPSLTGWAGVSDSQWAVHQRARQYRGPHNETYGGTTINMDNDNLDAPAATVAYGYKVTSRAGLNARTGPSTSHAIAKTHGPGSAMQVVCQAPGSAIAGSSVWDELTDGTYVTDSYVSTPSKTGYSAPLPRCGYPYEVTASPSVNERDGAGTSHPVAGQLPDGALAWVVCQKAGSAVKKTRVWDRLQDGHWVSDYYVATPSKTTYSGPAPRC
jgi:Domain of unknown function (DUF1906)